MSAQPSGSTQPQRARAGWRQWLQLLGAALLLLAVSEALWLWQTWPVRELLEVPVGATGGR